MNLSGADGQDGQDGSQIFAGDGPPDEGRGNEGDYYLDRENFQLYGPKSKEGWGEPIDLQGPEGDSGADGVSGWQRVTNSVEISANGGTQMMDISCPAGKNVLGGGGFVFSKVIGFDTRQTIVNMSAPVTDTSWRVQMTNNNSISATMTGYAICATVN